MEIDTQHSGSSTTDFDVDLFFDHVYNAAYDIFEDSFDTLEENVPLLLGNPSEEIMKATSKAFDAVFNSIQENLEKNLRRWEEYSRINCFSVRKAFTAQEDSSQHGPDLSLQIQDEQLDNELESVRAELHAAGKESARIRRELRNLERLLTVKKRHEAALQEAVTQLEDEDQQGMLEELVRVAGLLKEKLNKVKPERMQSPRGVRWVGSGRTEFEMTSLEGIAKTLNL